MNLIVNNTYHGFKLIEEKRVDDINSVGRVFEHEKTGARLLQLENDDDNKVFSISFRTPPDNSTGLPHILEHSVLCGSRKFQSKEPFVELVKGSLNTFLNAMTFSDKTMYPVASRNEKDFFNLMDVYLDAVFYPNIYKYPEILMQEGWHYELEDKNDEITYKGVVYNEMKGAFSSPESILMRKIEQSLFPETPYSHESGGDPKHIPELSYEEFITFHNKYYHPSNSYIFLYGNGDLQQQLEFIDSGYLKDFDRINVDSAIPLQKPFTEINKVSIEYPISKEESEEDKTYFALNFAVGRSNDAENYLAMDVLEHLLLATPASPLKKALIEAEIGKDVFGQYDNSIQQPVFSIVIKNSNPDKREEFKKIVDETLSGLVKNGIDKKLIEASINTKEFQLREADYRGYPKGLIYNIKCMDSWLYDDAPMLHLNFEQILEKIKIALSTNYFEKLIEEFLLTNKHSSMITLLPVKGLAEANAEKTRQKLSDYKAQLSDNEINEIIRQTKDLKERQNTPDSIEALESIPLLELNDIEPQAEELSQEIFEEAKTKVLYHPVFTNNIAYINLMFDTTRVSQDKLPYISLLSDILGKVSTENLNYEELSKEINIHTGDVKFNVQVYGDQKDEKAYYPKLTIKTKTLIDKIPKLFELVEEIIKNTRFDDKKRLKEIIREIKSRREMRISNEGHLIAVQRVFSYFSEQGKYIDILTGLSYYKFIAELERNFDAKADEAIEGIKEAAAMIFAKNNLLASITCEKEQFNALIPYYTDFVNKLMLVDKNRATYNFAVQKQNEGLLTQSNVQFVAQGYNFRKLGHSYTGSLQVLSTIARYDYLWNRIRVQGGAYGAMTGFERNGNMFFVSYRDPNLKETLKVYKDMEEYLKRFDIDSREMVKLVIGTMSKIDLPLTPAMKGERAAEYYIRGVSQEDIQRERDEIINCSISEIRKLSELIGELMKQSCYCVLGNESKLKQNSELFNNLVNVFE